MIWHVVSHQHQGFSLPAISPFNLLCQNFFSAVIGESGLEQVSESHSVIGRGTRDQVRTRLLRLTLFLDSWICIFLLLWLTSPHLRNFNSSSSASNVPFIQPIWNCMRSCLLSIYLQFYFETCFFPD